MPSMAGCREDFPLLRGNGGLVYLDNAATSLKPDCVIDAVDQYYRELSFNSGRGLYRGALAVDDVVEGTRRELAAFLGCPGPETVAFTHGATDSLNVVAWGYGARVLGAGDVVITTRGEHASCVLPWMEVCKRTGARIEFAPLDEEGRIDLAGLRSMMSPQVKVVALAQVTNVLGYETPVREVCELAHEVGAVVSVDGAQSVGHIPVDVGELGCDFLSFSAHKMCGPTGLGVLCGPGLRRKEMRPLFLGGGSNVNYFEDGTVYLRDAPYSFESGTLPLAQIAGLRAAVHYLQDLGMDEVRGRVETLSRRMVAGLDRLENVKVYNPRADRGIVTLNVAGLFAEDVARYLDSKGVCVRAGQHCSRLLEDQLGTLTTLRASIYFYNSEEDVDALCSCCAGATRDSVCDFIFNS